MGYLSDMPPIQRFAYKLVCYFTSGTEASLRAMAKAQNTTMRELVRKYVTIGLAFDARKYGITLPHDPLDTDTDKGPSDDRD